MYKLSSFADVVLLKVQCFRISDIEESVVSDCIESLSIGPVFGLSHTLDTEASL